MQVLRPLKRTALLKTSRRALRSQPAVSAAGAPVRSSANSASSLHQAIPRARGRRIHGSARATYALANSPSHVAGFVPRQEMLNTRSEPQWRSAPTCCAVQSVLAAAALRRIHVPRANPRSFIPSPVVLPRFICQSVCESVAKCRALTLRSSGHPTAGHVCSLRQGR